MGVDTTAENLAVLFMLLDKEVFGYDRFKITDKSLFGSYPIQPTTSGRVIRINNDSGYSGRSNRSATAILVCYETYYCGTISWCNAHGGCDYMNCPTNACFLLAEECEYYDEPPAGGGGGSPPGGGGSPPGGGGSGNPPGGDPPPCGGNPLRNTLFDPCGPGWVPIPEPGGGGSPHKKNLAIKSLR
jgi:hypothetical protein